MKPDAPSLRDCATLVFDCDGVLLDSNRIKTDAFREVGLRFGAEAADALVRYHVEHGGVSRYRKFEYLLGTVLEHSPQAGEVEALARDYGECVYRQLLGCRITPGLEALREATGHAGWMVVSGGDQNELRRVFAERGLAPLFDQGVHGSPASKDEILAREIAAARLRRPALFIGDSRYDHEAAARAGLDFVFVHEWSEFAGWREYCARQGLPVLGRVAELLAPGAD